MQHNIQVVQDKNLNYAIYEELKNMIDSERKTKSKTVNPSMTKMLQLSEIDFKAVIITIK